MEYVIENGNKWVVLHKSTIHWTSSHGFASVFTNKARAEKIAKKHGGKVELFFGTADPKGMKQFCPGPKTDPTRRNNKQPYKTM